jgi:hypothetical protein
MRLIAHWEGRAPVLTVGGTVTVIFAGTMAGLASGAFYGVMRRFIHNIIARNILFVLACLAFTWLSLNALLLRPRLMFVALTLVYAVALEIITAKKESAVQFSPDRSLNPTT